MNLVVRAYKHFSMTSAELVKTSRMYRYTAAISAVLVAIMIIMPIWKLLPNNAKDQFIPLHYNVYFGIDRFGPWYQIFVLPAIGISLLILNTIFQMVFYHRERVLSYFFAVTTLIAEITLIISMIFIILLNV